MAATGIDLRDRLAYYLAYYEEHVQVIPHA
jgi:hypothetical protein